MVEHGVPRLLIRTDRYLSAAVGRSIPMIVQAIAAAARQAAPPGTVGILFAEEDLQEGPRYRLLEQVVEANNRGAPRGGVPLYLLSPAAAPEPAGIDGAVLLPGDPRMEHDLAQLRMWSGPSAARLAVLEDGIAGCVVGPVQPPLWRGDEAPAGSLLAPEAVARVVAAWAPRPVLAFGGVGIANLASVLASGVAGVVVHSAVLASPDPAAAVQQLVDGLLADAGETDLAARDGDL